MSRKRMDSSSVSLRCLLLQSIDKVGTGEMYEDRLTRPSRRYPRSICDRQYRCQKLHLRQHRSGCWRNSFSGVGSHAHLLLRFACIYSVSFLFPLLQDLSFFIQLHPLPVQPAASTVQSTQIEIRHSLSTSKSHRFSRVRPRLTMIQTQNHQPSFFKHNASQESRCSYRRGGRIYGNLSQTLQPVPPKGRL